MKKSIGARTVVHPAPVFIVGTYDADGRPNMMNAAWGGICCSRPPCVMIALREATYTYGNIVHSKAFTVNIPSETHVVEADYFGIASGKTEDKLERAGLTPVKSELVNAPYVAEFPFALECRLLHSFEIGLHTQFVGQIMDVKVEESVLGDDRFPDIEKVRPLLYAPGSRKYYGLGTFVARAFSAGKELARQG